MPKADYSFRKGQFLAVRGEDRGETFWLCRVHRNVRKNQARFDVNWLEKDLTNRKGFDRYEIFDRVNSIEADTVLDKVKLVKAATKGFYLLPPSQKKLILNTLKRLDDSEDEGIDSEDEERPKKRKAKAAAEEKKVKKRAKSEPKLPNWRLKPNEAIRVWDRDPLFESLDEEVPFVSSVAHSKLAIRAVLCDDVGLLKRCFADRGRMHDIDVSRSMQTELSALDYAFKKGDLKMARLILKEEEQERKRKDNRVSAPVNMMKTVGTGRYNPISLGIRRIRRLQMSRGNREGNNALNKDGQYRSDDSASNLMKWGVAVETVKFALDMKYANLNEFVSSIKTALWNGNAEIAAHVIRMNQREAGLGCPYSRFHLEALETDGSLWIDAVREISVKKKTWEGVTPLHCACINPDPSALKKLFAACPEVNMSDRADRKLIHYAATCAGLGPLEFLSENGANLEDVDKQGHTPLILACQVGRLENARFMVETIRRKRKDAQNQEALKKLGVGGVNKATRYGYAAVHFACQEGHLDIVKMLVEEFEADAEKPLSVNLDKKTPLMLASASGHLDIVRFLCDKYCKIEKLDRYKRTAVTHAVMNGAANVVSYFLNRGANPNKCDSSGNAYLHYACAYGWYFCARVLIEAGAELNLANEWKLSPLAVAFLKGNSGLTKYLLDLPGIDINYENDDGKTVLLVMIAEAKPLTVELLTEIRDMVERRGADPTIADHEGQTVLHLLCRYSVFKAAETAIKRKKDLFGTEVERQRNILAKFIRFFINEGSDVMAKDKKGFYPVMRLMEIVTSDMTKTKDYETIELLLKVMKPQWRDIEVDLNEPTLMTSFAKNVSHVHIEKELRIYAQENRELERGQNRGRSNDFFHVSLSNVCKESEI